MLSLRWVSLSCAYLSARKEGRFSNSLWRTMSGLLSTAWLAARARGVSQKRRFRPAAGLGRPRWLSLGRRVDPCHVTQYSGPVIRSFADKQTEQFWVTGTLGRLPPDIE